MYIHVGNTSTLYVFVDERQVVQSVLLTALQMIERCKNHRRLFTLICAVMTLRIYLDISYSNLTFVKATNLVINLLWNRL